MRTLFHAGTAMLVAAGLTTAAEAQTPQKGGSAIFALAQDPSGVNPDTSSNLPDRQVGCIIYPGLVTVSPEYAPAPALAKSWSISPDGLTYTLNLVTTKWHDGQPFTSEDVKYTIQEVSSKFSAIFSDAGKAIDRIETPAPDKVVITLKQSYGPFMLALSCITGASPLPAHLFRGTDPLKNAATLTTPVGTGAFKLKEWKRGDYVKLERNSAYFDAGKPYLDEVIAKIIPQSSARLQALNAGEIDYLPTPPSSDRAAIEANPKLKTETSDIAPSFILALLNNSNKPLNDKRVRKALLVATDREYILKNASFNLGTVGVEPFPTNLGWLVNPEIDYSKTYAFDYAKANAMLDDAGFKRGADGKRFGLRIAVFANQYLDLQQTAVAMKSMWQNVGIDVTIEQLEDATLLKKVYSDRDYDIHLTPYTTYADPAFGIARAYVSATMGRPYGNPTGYSTKEIDDLFEKGARATVRDERAKYYREVQALIAEEMPSLTLRQYRQFDGSTKRLKGLWNVAVGNGAWADAWLEK